MGDNSEQKVPIHGLMITRVLNQEKSPDLLSHRGLEIFQPSAKCSMMIHEKNIPILDVPLFHFLGELVEFIPSLTQFELLDFVREAMRHSMLIHNTSDHRQVQINELNELCDQAYNNSLIYKEKTKRRHDSKIKNRVFNIGDRVLLFNSRLKIFSGKLKSRWSGPFTISQVYPYGTVELSQPDGPNFKVNGHRVKHYFGEDIPKLVVPDLQTFAEDH
nr:reverse transcriptase domain-containing protein [Tanacetum cinerariifolium]